MRDQRQEAIRRQTPEIGALLEGTGVLSVGRGRALLAPCTFVLQQLSGRAHGEEQGCISAVPCTLKSRFPTCLHPVSVQGLQQVVRE